MTLDEVIFSNFNYTVFMNRRYSEDYKLLAIKFITENVNLDTQRYN